VIALDRSSSQSDLIRFENLTTLTTPRWRVVVASAPAPMAGRFKAKPSAKPRVLAVDDEILNLRLATLMLQKSGFEVDQATDGYKALEMMEAKHQEYCLVTLDEVMPKLRGSEMLALWRKHEEKLQLPRLLVVMVTANGQLDDRITYDRKHPAALRRACSCG
jgi:CheY-like chemotaxis protein